MKMGKRAHIKEQSLGQTSDGHLQQIHSEPRKKRMSSSDDPEQQLEKQKKKHKSSSDNTELHPAIVNIKCPDNDRPDITSDGNFYNSDDKRKKNKRKSSLTGDESESSKKHLLQKTNEGADARSDGKTVKKKKKKLSVSEGSVNRTTDINSEPGDGGHKDCDELEEVRRQERKLKKKEKKLKKMNSAADTGTSDTTPNPAAPPSACKLALDYLSHWQNDREHWRFQKVRQVWLLHNMYDENKVEDSHFQTMLLYLDGLKGKSRETTVKQAEDIINLAEDSDAESKDLSQIKLERARQLIQVLT